MMLATSVIHGQRLEVLGGMPYQSEQTLCGNGFVASFTIATLNLDGKVQLRAGVRQGGDLVGSNRDKEGIGSHSWNLEH